MVSWACRLTACFMFSRRDYARSAARDFEFSAHRLERRREHTASISLRPYYALLLYSSHIVYSWRENGHRDCCARALQLPKYAFQRVPCSSNWRMSDV